MLMEGSRKKGSHSDRFPQRESTETHFTAFPHAQVYRSDDFVNDEMPKHGSIDFVALDGLRNGEGCDDSGSTETQQPSDSSPRWVGWRSRHRGRWAGRKRFRHRKDSCPTRDQGGQNGGYCDHTESRCHPPHHGVRDVPERHTRGDGRRPNPRRPGSRGSTARNGPDFLNWSGESGPVGGVQRTLSPPGKDLGAQPDVISRKKAKAKLRKLRQRALQADKAQAAQDRRTVAAVDDIADSTTKRQQVKPERKGKKRKESPTAAKGPKFKIVKTEPSGGDETHEDSTNKMKRVEKAAALGSASTPGAEGQSGVLSIEETLAHLKKKLQGKKVPLSDKQRKRGHSKRPGTKITADRIAFMCSVCKFSSFYRNNMAAHLQSKFHKDHFRFLSERLSEPTVDFLQTHLSYKHKKVEEFINQIPNHRATVCQLYEDQDLTRDISMEHFITKAEAAHCLACDVYIPMQYFFIQEHLKSRDHNYNCKAMMEQSKNSGLSTAQRILRRRHIRERLQIYLEDSVVTDGPEVKVEEAWSTGQRAGPEADMMAEEAELFCGQEVQAAEAVRDWTVQEAELFCGQEVQAAEAVGDGTAQEAEPLSEGVVPAAEKINMAAVGEEPVQHDPTELLFDLLEEEDDVEGVELGEEEMGEDDI